VTSEKVKVIAGIVALTAAIWFAFHMYGKQGKTDTSSAKTTPYDMICTGCKAEITIKLASWPPPPCPKCGENKLAIAAICPRCKTVAPMLDSKAFWENPYGALKSGKVIPKCPKDNSFMTPKISWRLQQEELRRIGKVK